MESRTQRTQCIAICNARDGQPTRYVIMNMACHWDERDGQPTSIVVKIVIFTIRIIQYDMILTKKLHIMTLNQIRCEAFDILCESCNTLCIPYDMYHTVDISKIRFLDWI